MKKREIIDAHTVKESIRIDFTKQLLALREDDDITEINFPSTLDNIERKFLHSLAGELGLKSRSAGKEDSRYITVSKPDDDDPGQADKVIIPFKLYSKSLSALQLGLAKFPIENINTPADMDASTKQVYSSLRSLEADAEFLRKSYHESQSIRACKSSFTNIQNKRAKLPSFQLKEEVCQLIKENQITLVSGETGAPHFDGIHITTCRNILFPCTRLRENYSGTSIHSR
jgi:hypothetical protein